MPALRNGVDRTPKGYHDWTGDITRANRKEEEVEEVGEAEVAQYVYAQDKPTKTALTSYFSHFYYDPDSRYSPVWPHWDRESARWAKERMPASWRTDVKLAKLTDKLLNRIPVKCYMMSFSKLRGGQDLRVYVRNLRTCNGATDAIPHGGDICMAYYYEDTDEELDEQSDEELVEELDEV